jgi:hypothetical protein
LLHNKENAQNQGDLNKKNHFNEEEMKQNSKMSQETTVPKQLHNIEEEKLERNSITSADHDFQLIHKTDFQSYSY